MKQRRGVLLGFLALGLAVSAAVPVLRAQSKGTPPNQPRPSRAGAGQAVSPAREGAWRENNVGVAELEQFRFADAAEAFKRALARDASLTAAKINLAIAYLYVPDIPAAKAAAQAALLAVPDAPQPNYLLALVARTEGRAEEAIPYLEKVLAKDPRDLGANVTLGQCYLQMREYEKAAATFRIAADAEPYNVSAAYNLGVALTRSGKREEGQAAMQRFQKLRDSGYKTALGSNYMEQGRYAEALGSTGAEAEAVDPQTPAVKLVEGEVPAGASPQAAAPTLWTAKALPAGLQQALPRAALVLADVDGDGAPDVIEAGLPSLRVAREDGPSLGLPERTSMAGLAPIDAGVLGKWGVAVVATAQRVRDREIHAEWRFALGSLVVSAIVAFFGGRALRKERAEALAEATRAADERLQHADKLATMGALATGIAHEVATPLGVILGRAEQLAPRVAGDEKASRAVQAIKEQSERIDHVVRGFLRLARGDRPTLEHEHPEALVRAAVDLARHRFAKAGVALDVDVPDALPKIACEARLFEQVLVNLLLNACDACVDAGRGGVTIGARAEDGKVIFQVDDEGSGIGEEAAARATEAFFTTKPSGRGTGLGLAIANEIVKHHRGTLSIATRAPRGTRASVEIPVSP